MPEPSVMHIKSPSATLYTVAYRKENAPTVILLHGGPGVPMQFSLIAEQLSRQYQVIVFDQRGTARSPIDSGATYSIDAYLDDIDAVVDHFGTSEFHLFGHSWGGLYAQIYAQSHPGKILSLFLCSPASGTAELWKQTEQEVMCFNKNSSGFWKWTQMGLLSLLGMLGSDRAYQSLFRRVLENYNRPFAPSFSATAQMVENVRAEPINKTRPAILSCPPLKDAPEYRFPIIITYGKMDIYGDSRHYVRRRFPQARFIEFEHAGHLAWKQNPGAFTHTLADFYHLR